MSPALRGGRGRLLRHRQTVALSPRRRLGDQDAPAPPAVDRPISPTRAQARGRRATSGQNRVVEAQSRRGARTHQDLAAAHGAQAASRGHSSVGRLQRATLYVCAGALLVAGVCNTISVFGRSPRISIESPAPDLRRAAAAALTEQGRSRPDPQAADFARRPSSRRVPRARPLPVRWLRRCCSRKQQTGVSVAARSKGKRAFRRALGSREGEALGRRSPWLLGFRACLGVRPLGRPQPVLKRSDSLLAPRRAG
jgi:hypothetical protein